MAKGLRIAEPPKRREPVSEGDEPTAPAKETGTKFSQMREDEMVQFNKRIKRSVADGYHMLSIKTRRKVPQLLEEALALLEEKHGKV